MNFKFGVLYCKADQTGDDDFFSNGGFYSLPDNKSWNSPYLAWTGTSVHVQRSHFLHGITP